MMLVRLTALAGCYLAVAHAKTLWHEVTVDYTFDDYAREFNRAYPGSEFAARQAVFEVKRAEIIAHNDDPASTYRKGVNQFTDRLPEELKMMNGLDRKMLHHTRALQTPKDIHTIQGKEPAHSLDWRDMDVVTPVKNQGNCGSCWAFASTEAIESHWALHSGALEELSEQFILDCTPNTHKCGGTGGCGGGTGELAMNRLLELGGIPSEWTYPYTSGSNGTAGICHGTPLGPAAPHSGSVAAAAVFTGVKSTKTNSYEAMLDALQLGPLAVSVDALAWHDYETGVFNGGNMTNPTLDHLVQLVGYGTEENGDDYWLIRNSWSPLWGEKGYMKLMRYGLNNPHCGVDLNPLDGNGCDDGPPTVEVCGQSGVLYDGVYPTFD